MSAMVPPRSQPGPPTVPELCVRFELEEDARALSRAEQPPPAFVAALLDAELFPDAIRFLAHALPRREAVWWAWTCARRTLADEEVPPEIRAALDAVERWIREPTEPHRRPMLDVAELADIGTPAGCAALAVFFAGGSIAPPDAPEVPPPEYAAAKAIAGSVIFSAVLTEPEKAPEKFRGFAAQGLEVARRVRLWPDAADPAAV